MDLLPSKLSYVYILKVTAKTVTLLRFMTFSWALSAPSYNIHARENEPYMLKNEKPTQCVHGSTGPTVIFVRYMQLERCNGSMDRHSSVKQLDEN